MYSLVNLPPSIKGTPKAHAKEAVVEFLKLHKQCKLSIFTYQTACKIHPLQRYPRQLSCRREELVLQGKKKDFNYCHHNHNSLLMLKENHSLKL